MPSNALCTLPNSAKVRNKFLLFVQHFVFNFWVLKMRNKCIDLNYLIHQTFCLTFHFMFGLHNLIEYVLACFIWKSLGMSRNITIWQSLLCFCYVTTNKIKNILDISNPNIMANIYRYVIFPWNRRNLWLKMATRSFL